MFPRFPLFLVVVLVCLLNVGCSGAVDAVVDSRVSSMIDEQNAKLPSDVARGVTLMKLEYDKESNLVTFVYHCDDPDAVKANIPKLEFDTNKRALADGSVKDALERGIRFQHKYFGKDGSSQFHSFETKKE